MLHLIPFVRVDTVGLCYTSGHGALPFLLPRCLIDTSVALGYQPRQKDEAGIKVYNALYALHVTPLTGAPKSRIGGSGTTALSLVNNMHSAARVELLLPFEVVGSFFRSLLFTSFLALCLLLGKPFARRHRSLRRVWLSCATPSVLGVNLALRCASPDCPVLDWRVAAKKRCRHPTERATCRSYGSPSLLGRLAFACLGFSEFPFLVRAAPHPDLATLLGFQFLPEIASASQSLPEDLPDRATSTQDCLSHAGIRTNAAIGDDKTPCTTSFVRVPPSLPGAVRKSQDSSILGVTIYAPFFVPTFFGLRTEKDVQLEAVLAAVREIGHMPSRHLDVLIPITRQRFDLSLGLLAFPSFLLQVKPAICPVILDLTRVGGHYCADTLPSPCSRHEFLEHIAMLIWYHEEEVEIWIDNSEFPASHGVLSFAPGSVFTVVLHGIGPMRTYDVKEVLSPNAVWGPFEHSPSPRGPMGTAIVDTREAAYMPVSMLSPLWPDQNVHRALKLAPHEGVLPTEFHVYLDIHGKQCHTVFSGPSDAHPWLIDFRPLGFQMRVVYSRIEPDLATALAALGQIDVGNHELSIHRVPSRARDGIYLPWLVVYCGPGPGPNAPPSEILPADFMPDCATCSFSNAALPEQDVTYNEHATRCPLTCKSPSDATPNLQAAVAQVIGDANVALLPAPLHRIGELPPEHPQHEAALAYDEDFVDEMSDAVVLIFSQDVMPETVRLRLEIPCTTDDLLLQLADACDSHRYIFFPEHTPARPQPSQWWIAVIAQPAWAAHEPTVLLNLSSVDGRCFVASAPHFFNRGQILRLAGLANDGSFEVFPFMAFEPMTAESEIRLVPCGTITIRRAGGPRVVQGFLLENMLRGGTMWAADPDLPTPPGGHRSLLIHGHGSGVVHPRHDDSPPDASEVAALCGARSEAIRLTDAQLHASDVLSQGFHCQHLFGVSFSEDNLLTEGRDHAFVAFIDCRPLLQGWSMETSPDGLLSHEELTGWLDTFAPPNWQPQIEGAPIHDGNLVVPHGAVLVASYVPISSSDEDIQDGPGEADSSDSSDDSDEDDVDQPGPPCDDALSHTNAGADNASGLGVSMHEGASSANRTASRSRSRGRTRSHHFSASSGLPCWAHTGAYGLVVLACPVKASPSLSYAVLWSEPALPHVLPGLTVIGVLCGLIGLVLLRPLLHWISCAQRSSDVFAKTPCPRAAKVIAEPQCRTSAERRHLGRLRYWTRRLGGEWLPRPPFSVEDHPQLDEEDPDDPTDSDSDSATVVHAHFVVLKHDFTPELVTVPLALPCTQPEALGQVQLGRDPFIRSAFPLLLEVSPQPCSGQAVCIGAPAWSPQPGVCIDTIAVDRRIFVAYAPTYVSRQDLISLADLPEALELEVWIGGNELLRDDDPPVHVYPGVLIRFLPSGTRPLEAPSLGQALLSARWWGDVADVPRPRIDRAYCIASRGQGQLYIADHTQPTRYRQDIAHIAGLRQDDMALFPAQPRPGDVSLNGVPCRTVIAAGVSPQAPRSTSWHLVILDGRRLEAGWLAAVAYDGRFDAWAVLHDLEDIRPRGWQLRLRPEADPDGFARTSPGQVFILDTSPATQTIALAGSGGGVSVAQTASNPTGVTAPPSSLSAQPSPDDDDDPAAGPGGDGWDEEPGADSGRRLTLMHFALFTPEYDAEIVSVYTDIPPSLNRVLTLIADARDPNRQRLFPRLIPVRVQPPLSFVCFLAMPSWDFEGVPVLIASDVPQYRIFADLVPGYLVREAVLRLAKVEEDAPVDVFLSDIPWSYQGSSRLYVVAGDLIRICSRDHPIPPPVEFSWILEATDGWHEDLELPGPFDDCFWLLSDNWPQRILTGVGARPPLATAVAAILDAPEASLTVAPATRPIRDHAHAGFPSRQVILAVEVEIEGDIPFLLDQRPVLLGIQWALAHDGRVDVQELCNRHQRRCPPGHFIRLIGGFAAGDVGNHYRFVFAGQVIVVEFYPRRSGQVPVPPPAGGGPPPDEPGDDDADEPRTDMQDPSAASSSSRPDAGTGSTQRGGFFGDATQHGLASPSSDSCRSGAKWRPSVRHDACAAGSWIFTPDFPLALLGTPLVGIVLGLLSGLGAFPHPPVASIWPWFFVLVIFACCHGSDRWVAQRRHALRPLSPFSARVGLFFFVLCACTYTASAGRAALTVVDVGGRCAREVLPTTHYSARVLPTPAWNRPRLPRSSPKPEIHPDVVEPTFSVLGPHHTLLEESLASPESDAMFCAATLLETLVEYFGATAVSPRFRTAPATQRQQRPPFLYLADLVPPPADQPSPSQKAVQIFDLDSRQCVLPGSEGRVASLFRPVSTTGLEGIPPGLRVPGLCREWLLEGCVGRSPSPEETLVLTSDGSFMTAGKTVGWGIVCSLVKPGETLPGQFIGCLFGGIAAVLDKELAAEVCHDAYAAEVAGLTACAFAAIQLRVCCPLIVRADNTSALEGVQGNTSMRNDPLCTAARCLHAAAGNSVMHSIRYQHVAGHAGEAANELADSLAKFGCSGKQFLAPLHLLSFCRDDIPMLQWLPHICFTRARSGEVPALHDQVMSWSREPGVCRHPPSFAMAPFLRAFPAQDDREKSALQAHCVKWTVASFNALSLQEGDTTKEFASGLHGMTGRPSLLRSSLEATGVHIAGIQECRTPKGTLRCGCYTRFASGADPKSCFGVELWIHDSSPCPASSIVVLYTSPTVLIASGRYAGQDLRFLVAHGPHRAHDSSVKQDWWKHTSHLCHSYAGSGVWIMMLDANCRVGHPTSRAVSGWQADPEDESGSLFHQLLLALDAWLPATFEHAMWGDGGTLKQKRNGHFDRSDFVAVPDAWRSSKCISRVEPEISAGHTIVDHYAAFVSLEVLSTSGARAGKRCKRIDVDAIADPANADVINQVLCTAPRPRWDVDASEHAALLVDHIYCGLASAFPVQRRRMRAGYLSEQSEALHRVVSGLRHAVRNRKTAHRSAFLRCAWLAWRSATECFHDHFCGKWLLQLEVRLGLSCMLLRRYGLVLRRSCRADRNNMYTDLAADVANANPADMHLAVKKVLRPRKFRKAHVDPLPTLYKADGSQCLSADEVTATWREHFKVLEGGSDTHPLSLLAECRVRQGDFEGVDSIPPSELPTWLDLEAAFRHTSGHKAAGPDLLPPMLCRRFSSQMTLLFWPLLLKTACRASEAAGMKGGILHHICKPQPKAPHTCEAHRGILVQSAVSKAFHRSLRRLLVRHWTSEALPLQIGGRAGCSASFGSLCSRAVLHFARKQGLSASLIFIDLSAAYYAVIRETLFGKSLSDRPVSEIAAALNLGPDDLQELTRLIEHEAILPQQGASEFMQEIAMEFHQNTWFIMSGDSQLVATHRGTRPGGTLADILFSLLFGQALKRRKSSSLRTAVPCVPWTGERTPFGSDSSPVAGTRDISDLVYADDLCIPVVCADAGALRNTVSAVAADTFDTLAPHALRVNFGPTKTAAIMAPVGSGSRQARQEIFCTLRGRAPIWAECRGMQWLDLVARYRHLGSIITHDGSMTADVKHRLALARAAFRDGKRRLFACKDVPISKRAILFRSHVLSTLLAGVGGWPSLGACDWQLFSSGVVSLYRQLLGLRTQGKWNYTSVQLFAMTGLPSPQSLLQLERLRFLSQLVRHGPDELWALVGHFTPYQAALRDASVWLLDAVQGTCNLGPIDEDWRSWSGLFLTSPGKWKGILKRAEAWHGLRDALRATFDEIVRTTWASSRPEATTSLSRMEHCCLLCGLAFASRQQWGAHAQKVHGYRNTATQLARGRVCHACGSQYANRARLRCHLLASPRCLQFLEQGCLDAETVTSEGHSQAPVVRGWGQSHLPAPQPELCAALSKGLAGMQQATDQQIFDEVSSHVAPLPVLRRTLTFWRNTLQHGPTRDAADDVLLILAPEHLCSGVAGKDLDKTPDEADGFCPLVLPLHLIHPAPTPSLLLFGSPTADWISACGFAACASTPLDLASFASSWSSGLRCYGAFVDFPPPPWGSQPIRTPSPGPLKRMRDHCEWAQMLLRVFCCLFRTATLGRPVCLRVAMAPEHFEPITGWVAQSALNIDGPLGPASPCFTLEFVKH